MVKAWDQARGWWSGGRRSRRRLAPAGRRPGWRRGAGRRAGRARRGGRGGAVCRRPRIAARAARAQALAAVGALQGSSPPVHPSPGVIPNRVPSAAAAAASAAPPDRAPAAAKGRTAQAAAESSPEPGSPAERTSPRGVTNFAIPGVARPPARPTGRFPPISSGFRPVGGRGRAAGDGVAEVVAGGALLVIGEVAPGAGRCGRAAAGKAGRPVRRRGDTQPAASPWGPRPGTGAPVSSKRAAGDRQAGEEAGDSTGIPGKPAAE